MIDSLKRLVSDRFLRLRKNRFLHRSASILGAQVVLTSVVGLLFQYGAANVLEARDFGMVIWVNTVLNVLGTFCGLSSLSNASIAAIARGHSGALARLLPLKLVGGSAAALALLVFAIISYVRAEHALAALFLVASICSPFLWLDIANSYWMAKARFNDVLRASAYSCFASIVVICAGIFVFPSPIIFLLSQQGVSAVFNILWAYRVFRNEPITKKYCPDMEKFGLFNTKIQVFGAILSQIDRIAIVYLFGFEYLAVFALGELIVNYLLKLPSGILSNIYQPSLSQMSLGDGARWILQRQGYLFTLLLLATFFLWIFLPLIGTWLLPASYNESIYLARLFSLSLILLSPTILTGTLIKSHAVFHLSFRTALVLWVTGIFPVITGALWGFRAVMIGRLIGDGITGLWYFAVLYRLARQK